MGEWKQTTGKWYGGGLEDKGLQTSQDHRFYGMSAKIPTVINNTGKELVIQYSVKHENNLDCGGAYIKLLPEGNKFDADSFGGDTPYAIMFGPDACGSTKRTL
jgi:calreticulin